MAVAALVVTFVNSSRGVEGTRLDPGRDAIAGPRAADVA
jgi:hypothetical protein